MLVAKGPNLIMAVTEPLQNPPPLVDGGHIPKLVQKLVGN